MRKRLKWFGFCLLIPAVLWCGSVVSNRLALRENLIRLHVVAASDSEEDQAVKLRVRDALISALEAPMAGITDKDEARACLQEKLPELQSIAQRVLLNSGCEAPVLVSLTEEAFDTRVYDTFTLPAGVYDAGEGMTVTIEADRVLFPLDRDHTCLFYAGRAEEGGGVMTCCGMQEGVLRMLARPLRAPFTLDITCRFGGDAMEMTLAGVGQEEKTVTLQRRG